MSTSWKYTRVSFFPLRCHFLFGYDFIKKLRDWRSGNDKILFVVSNGFIWIGCTDVSFIRWLFVLQNPDADSLPTFSIQTTGEFIRIIRMGNFVWYPELEWVAVSLMEKELYSTKEGALKMIKLNSFQTKIFTELAKGVCLIFCLPYMAYLHQTFFKGTLKAFLYIWMYKFCKF